MQRMLAIVGTAQRPVEGKTRTSYGVAPRAVCMILAIAGLLIGAPAAESSDSPSGASIQHIGTLLRPGGYGLGIAFSRTQPYAYANGGLTTFASRAVDVIDIRDPEAPKVVGSVPLPGQYMEDIDLGERSDGTKFVLVTAPVSTDGPSTYAVHVIDVTDATKPYVRSRIPLFGPVHTITCVSRGCDYAYGPYDTDPETGRGFTPIFDLRNLDQPSQLPPQLRSDVLQHDWNRDANGVMWLAGFGGVAAYDASNPAAPVLLNATDKHAARANADNGFSPYNDKSHLHGSLRPNADRFKPNAPPSYANGNVLLVSEEGNNVDCTDGFETWWVPTLDPSFQPTLEPLDPNDPFSPEVVRGTITPLDYWSLADDVGMAPNGELCSVHWFDFHPRGFVVVPTYGQGTRLLDVRDPKNIKEVAVAETPGNKALASDWVPERTTSGIATGHPSALVYTADGNRGIDIFRVHLPK